MMRTVLTPSLGAVLLFGLLASGCSDNESSNENTSNLDASTNSGKSDAQTTGSDTNMSSAIPEKECGSAPKNKGLCVPGTDINCHVKCGPDKIGKRPCVCNPTTSQWECIPCVWDADKDHSCYKKADTPPLCGGGVLPRNNYDCTDKPCSPCKDYKDSNDTVREGFCVCTNGKYSCATSGEWPCGTAKGCI